MRLAVDLGERLLPAFVTPTGIPYGTVNLRYGVPVGETEIASTAGAGSLLVEFEVLSALSNDHRFGDAAFLAVQALYSRRSYLNLLGKHIHTSNGQWHESTSGIGSNADSFYEYLLKGHLLTQRGTLFAMFTETYRAVKRHIQVGDWFTEVDMFNGKTRRNRVENLQAFWPGMESSLGLCDSAARLLNTFYAVSDDIGFLPEEFDQAAWLDNKVISNSWYPLRPELIESTYHQYRSTGDRTWLSAGASFLAALENNTKTECGFASVSNIGTMQLTNSMPSYFLSETCKYLYLLFDQDNFVHDRPYIFSTEAHPFDPLQLPMRLDALRGSTATTPILSHPLPLRCQKGLWWDSSSLGYDAEYVRDQQRKQSSRSKGSADAARVSSYTARRTIAALNSAKIAALLHSSSLPDVHRGEGAPDAELTDWMLGENNGDHPDTCYDGDAALHSPSPDVGEVPVNHEKQPPPQKITVNAQTLGEFDVSVYPDGFVVVSKEHGDTIEISNIGESVVFVGYVWGTPDSQSKAFITDHLGRTVTCTVGLLDGAGDPLVNDEERSCSIAMFGPESLPQFPIVAELHVPPSVNEMVCKSLETPLSSAVDVMRSKVLLESPESQKSWWREWPSATSISSMLSLRYLKTGSSLDAESEARVVLARRGDCLFEDKTLIAQNAGAAAVLIANNEVSSDIYSQFSIL
jgi:Glycosyl hydrolase family 47